MLQYMHIYIYNIVIPHGSTSFWERALGEAYIKLYPPDPQFLQDTDKWQLNMSCCHVFFLGDEALKVSYTVRPCLEGDFVSILQLHGYTGFHHETWGIHR